jgi:hypothetical protein
MVSAAEFSIGQILGAARVTAVGAVQVLVNGSAYYLQVYN